MLMSPPSTTDVLNRILVLHERSLSMYLSYAPPADLQASERAKAVLGQIVEDQRRTIDRLATLVLDGSGTVDYGEFPLSFTSLHDLSLKYLLNLLIDRQRKLVAVCERLAEQLNLAPFAQAAARESVGEAKGHLDNLLELQKSLA
ncbi:MAG TPA: hypothetical protein VFB80_17895 [Pirellulaceae bacterium]|nr:hypothetical protein [Pirellulaceae bacterium]